MLKLIVISLFCLISIDTICQKDSIASDTNVIETPTYVADSSHSPKKATIMSAVLPGLGQIYNDIHKPSNKRSRLWWKLPLIYGGLGTGAYFFIQNQKEYSFFRDKRLELLDSGNSSISIEGYPYSLDDDDLKSLTDQYARWRDLSVVGTLAVYLINIIDANVEGTLIHFDSSDDLSFEIRPASGFVSYQAYAGASLKLTF